MYILALVTQSRTGSDLDFCQFGIILGTVNVEMNFFVVFMLYIAQNPMYLGAGQFINRMNE